MDILPFILRLEREAGLCSRGPEPSSSFWTDFFHRLTELKSCPGDYEKVHAFYAWVLRTYIDAGSGQMPPALSDFSSAMEKWRRERNIAARRRVNSD